MSILWLCLIVAAFALLIIARAARGVRVDDHPVCRGCRYDLSGSLRLSAAGTHPWVSTSDGEMICPECGADLSSRLAIQFGNRRRRPGLLAGGVTLLLLSLGSLGAALYLGLPGVDWMRHKPFAWTLHDARQHAGLNNEPNARELQRRLRIGSLSAKQVDRLVTAALDVQGDRSINWTFAWNDLLDDLLRRKMLTPAQVERYLKQAWSMRFQTRPVMRRGRGASFDLSGSFDRLTNESEVIARSVGEPVTIGGVEMFNADLLTNDTRGKPEGYFHIGSHIFTSLPAEPFAALPDGPTTLEGAATLEVELVHPAAYPKTTWRIAVSLPTALAAHNAIVDTFEADASQRGAMEAAWRDTRVETEGEDVKVWIRLDPLPVAMSMGVWLTQAGESWRVGSLLVEAGNRPRWIRVVSNQPQQPGPGEVTVELRPDQEAADGQMELRTYWGDVMTRQGIVVNAPYAPAFNLDKTLAPAMEKAVSLDRVSVKERRGRLEIDATLQTTNSPARIAYRVRIRLADQWLDTSRYKTLHAHSNTDGYHYHTTDLATLPDPSITTADFLFVPDPEWEARDDDPTPPWGYPILFENVPLPRIDQGASRTGEIHGRAVIDDPFHLDPLPADSPREDPPPSG